MAKELAWKASKAEKAPWVRVPCSPPLESEPNIVVTLTTFGFAVSMEDLEELYERHCGRSK